MSFYTLNLMSLMSLKLMSYNYMYQDVITKMEKISREKKIS